jgi:hypothetical protein
MCKDSKVISNFIQNFAHIKNIDAADLVSIQIDADGSSVYKYIDRESKALHTVEELQ